MAPILFDTVTFIDFIVEYIQRVFDLKTESLTLVNVDMFAFHIVMVYDYESHSQN